jgi:hypothetical protein
MVFKCRLKYILSSILSVVLILTDSIAFNLNMLIFLTQGGHFYWTTLIYEASQSFAIRLQGLRSSFPYLIICTICWALTVVAITWIG